tara:strand:+ start:60 stop:482 length:423 start_codon:yes stop_codon:yes gene_type:complete
MKKTLIAIVALCLPAAALANPYDYTVVRVIDGDTVKVEAPWVPVELGKEISIRVIGIDTPEKGGRAKCPAEAALGAKATKFAQEVIKPGQVVQVNLISWDKFGGRIDATILVNGKDFGKMQIDAGLARPYDGGTKSSWCN